MPIYSAYVCNDSSETLPRILEIHMPNGGLIADVTWGRGVFWKKIQNGQPNLFNGATYTIIGSDIEQRADVKADFRCLPYRDKTFDCVVLDPPWANLSTPCQRQNTTALYNLKPMTVDELIELYQTGMLEAARILKVSGILIVKGQDVVTQNNRVWISYETLDWAPHCGLRGIDRMVQVGPFRPLASNIKQQRHFRARESFYWIFRKV